MYNFKFYFFFLFSFLFNISTPKMNRISNTSTRVLLYLLNKLVKTDLM